MNDLNSRLDTDEMKIRETGHIKISRMKVQIQNYGGGEGEPEDRVRTHRINYKALHMCNCNPGRGDSEWGRSNT